MMFLVFSSTLWAGSYTESGHGSKTDGVYRTAVGNPPIGYARGNCAHCHEQHASIAGAEPDPEPSVAPYLLFATFFNTARVERPYSETDDFCFFCHNSTGSAQQVTNFSYSRNFGCGTLGPTSIMEAMNGISQRSYHNLYDIYEFSRTEFSWFNNQGNPCSACHNPHKARRNWGGSPMDPATYSAISRPTDHFNLWGPGASETMGDNYNTQYEPPLCSTDREPDNSTDADGRANTPDYAIFCTDCHDKDNTIDSQILGTVRTINWFENVGDKHGLRNMDGGLDIKTPYTGSDYILSCTDCHEPHGSVNVMLIRTRVNGVNLEGAITRFDTTVDDSNVEWSYLCRRCHEDDAENADATDTNTANAWEYVHHIAPDYPYDRGGGGPGTGCNNCHNAPGQAPINCDACHFHGADITVTAGSGGTRRAF